MNADTDDEDDFDDLSGIKPLKENALESLDYEVADVCFGKGGMKEMNLLVKLGDL